jgi:hypothetical protein
MTLDTSNRPGYDEQYIVATNTSDLTLDPDRTCAATHLIAAGLLGNRMGEALVHLRAEWDAAAKPRKHTENEIAVLAEDLPKKHGKLDVKRARTQALLAYAAGMRHRAHQMRGWLPALSILAEWAHAREVDPDLLSPALYHWLNPTCPVCDGHGVRKIEGAPALSAKQCHHCGGAGTWPRPLGAQRIHDWLKGCVGKAKTNRSGLMRGDIDAGDLRDRSASTPKPAAEDERGAAAVAEVARRSMGQRRKPF